MRIKAKYETLRTVSSLLTVLLFALAPFVHGWAELLTSHEHHSHNSTLCSPEAELDACHRLLFHHDHTTGCDHTHHIEESVQDCSLCAVVASLSVVLDDHHSQSATAISEPQRHFFKIDNGLRSAIGFSLPKRGPPLYTSAAFFPSQS